MAIKIKIRIIAARNLPVMDRATELTDAFVEVCNNTNLLFLNRYQPISIIMLMRYFTVFLNRIIFEIYSIYFS